MERFRLHPSARILRDGATLRDAATLGPAPETAPLLAGMLGGGPVEAPLRARSAGSSGRPRIIRRSHASWIRSFELHARIFDAGPHSPVAIAGALSHSLALFALVEALHLGATALPLHGLAAAPLHAALAEARILYASPAQIGGIAALLRRRPPLPRLALVLTGGGPLAPHRRAEAQALFPHAAIREFYGAAETSFATLAGPDTPPGAVGPAYPGAQIAIRDPDAAGTGEVWIRSPYLFEGYETDPSPHTRRDGGWLTVGEIGALDASGDLRLRGRRGRMITIADRNVFPEDCERLLAADPAVESCAAVPLPDGARGMILVAAVVARPEALAAEGAAGLRARLLEACRAGLGHAAPRRIALLETLPAAAAGKPDAARLAALLARR